MKHHERIRSIFRALYPVLQAAFESGRENKVEIRIKQSKAQVTNEERTGTEIREGGVIQKLYTKTYLML